MRKRVIIVSVSALVVCILLVMSLLYVKNEKRIHPEFLYNARWSRYSQEADENFNITFTKNGKFHYESESGKSVKGLEKFNRYSYNERFDRITLSGEGSNDLALIKYYDNHSLAILFDDGVHIFKNKNNLIESVNVDSIKEYVDTENSIELYVRGFKDGLLTVAPYDYDGDAKKNFSEYIKNLKTDSDVKFTSVTIYSESGKEDITVYELSEEDYKHIGEYYTSGFLRFDEWGDVCEVVFFGITTVYG